MDGVGRPSAGTGDQAICWRSRLRLLLTPAEVCTKIHTWNWTYWTFAAAEFTRWYEGLKDAHAATIIDARIRRLAVGQTGDVKSLGDRVSELRIHYGPGYRLYFTRRGDSIVLLLCGGVKKRQEADIAEAKRLEREIGNDS